MKSSSSAGPRRPAFSEFWLSATGTPWLVVSARSPESTRTRSSGAVRGIEPGGGAPDPDLRRGIGLGERAAGGRRIARRDVRARAAVRATRRHTRPALLGFSGIAAASSPAAAILLVAASPGSSACDFADGPLTVERAEERAIPATFPGERLTACRSGALRAFRRAGFFFAMISASADAFLSRAVLRRRWSHRAFSSAGGSSASRPSDSSHNSRHQPCV